jgi:hypothetical protein
MKSFAKRLQDCMDKGRLTGADLAIWFDRPYPTVRMWRLGLSEPWKPWREDAELHLVILEGIVRSGVRTPIPSSYNAAARRLYMKRLRDVWKSRLSETHPAK